MAANVLADLAAMPINTSAEIGGMLVVRWAGGFEVQDDRIKRTAADAAAKIAAHGARVAADIVKRRARKVADVDSRLFTGTYTAARAHFGGPVVKLPGTGILQGSLPTWTKREATKSVATRASSGVSAKSTSRPRKAASAAKEEESSMTGAPLRARIAKALGWTEAGVNSFSLSMLREMVRDTSPQLSDEIGRSLSTGSHVVGEYRPRRKLR